MLLSYISATIDLMMPRKITILFVLFLYEARVKSIAKSTANDVAVFIEMFLNPNISYRVVKELQEYLFESYSGIIPIKVV